MLKPSVLINIIITPQDFKCLDQVECSRSSVLFQEYQWTVCPLELGSADWLRFGLCHFEPEVKPG